MPIHELVAATVVLMLIAVAIRVISKRLNLPFSILLVLAGVLLAHLAGYAPEHLRHFARTDISPDIFLMIFLPTLVFESAFNLDARQLKRNLLPVLFLAVPGVLLSTAAIGVLLWWLTPLGLSTALILGALLSATDPVAVIALFKQLGAPKRLTVLVEGESLFNDATAIVLTRIIIAVALSGTVSAGDIASGIGEFFTVFVGGLLVGTAAALLVGLLLGRVNNDPFIEVPLTVILAYTVFLLAETLHTSGVMAVVAAGITMGGWGRTKISPAVSHYLSELWEYFAFLANALIFLLVGLLVDLPALWEAIDLLAWVIVAMLLSRLLVVYALVPLANRLPGAHAVNRTYQHIMYWGGLRGAIALALALGLPESPYKETLVALTAGAVLFTLLVQGLSIGPLVHRLGLDTPAPEERLAAAGAALDAVRTARNEIGLLRGGGLFSARVADELEREYATKLQKLTAQRNALTEEEFTEANAKNLLLLYGFVTEKRVYRELFEKGFLREENYRALGHSLNIQIDRLRLDEALPEMTLYSTFNRGGRALLLRILEPLLSATGLLQRLSNRYTAQDYSKSWAQLIGSTQVLRVLPDLARLEGFGSDTLESVETIYRRWQQRARDRLESTAEQFPEFIGAVQERHARRLLLLKERQVIREYLQHDQITERMGTTLLGEIEQALTALRGYDANALSIDPDELLAKVPFFRHLSPNELTRIKTYLHPLTLPPESNIIVQDEAGSSMFFIARGVIRVLRREENGTKTLGTLMGGDFFGEHSLLHHAPRNATCRTVTACALYELHRSEFKRLIEEFPDLKTAFDRVDQRR